MSNVNATSGLPSSTRIQTCFYRFKTFYPIIVTVQLVLQELNVCLHLHRVCTNHSGLQLEMLARVQRDVEHFYAVDATWQVRLNYRTTHV